MEHNELFGSVNGASYSAFISQKYSYSPTRIVFKLFSHVETATILNKPHERTDKQIKLPVTHDAGMENYMNIAI